MCGMQPVASATPLRRSQTLPPSEMKSLYGSITSRPVTPGANVMGSSFSRGGGPWKRHLVAIGRQRNGGQPDDECRQVPHLREGGPEGRVDGQRGDGGALASGSPRRPDIARQCAGPPEDEVARPYVAGVHESPRRAAPADQQPQVALADVGTNDMGRQADEKPTPPAQSPFSRGDDADEDGYIRPPLAV